MTTTDISTFDLSYRQFKPKEDENTTISLRLNSSCSWKEFMKSSTREQKLNA